MQTRILQIYGQNKLREETDPKRALAEAKKAEKIRRKVEEAENPAPVLLHGDIIGRFELLGKAYEKGYFQPLSRGNWRAKCLECGRECVLPGWKVQRRQVYACCIKRPRKAYPVGVRTRPPNDLAGQTFGRLLVEEYKTNYGWVCLCVKCGQRELVRFSRMLPARGREKCGQTSAPVSSSSMASSNRRRTWLPASESSKSGGE